MGQLDAGVRRVQFLRTVGGLSIRRGCEARPVLQDCGRGKLLVRRLVRCVLGTQADSNVKMMVVMNRWKNFFVSF